MTLKELNEKAGMTGSVEDPDWQKKRGWKAGESFKMKGRLIYNAFRLTRGL